MNEEKSSLKMLIGLILIVVVLLSSVLVAKIIKVPVSNATDKLTMSALANLDKYINYNLSEESKGTLVQYSVQMGIEYEENQNYVPIEQSELNMNLNQIDGKYPSSVKVIAENTGATNGNNKAIRTNYEYDNATGNIRIITSNMNEKNEIVNATERKEAKDKYIIVCYYDTYVAGNVGREIGFNLTANSKIQREEDNKINKQGEFRVQVSENQGDLTSIEHETDEIYNGYIKSNAINGTEYVTQYKETAELIISKKDVQDSIMLKENNSFIQASQNNKGEEISQELGNGGNLVYKSTKIAKQNIQDVLGEDGTLQILDIQGNIIAEINKDTVYGEDGTITIGYEAEPEALVIKTSKVLNEGMLQLENVKEIKSGMKVADSVKIKTTSEIVGTKEEKESYNQNKENIVEIKEAQTEVEFNVDNIEWTNEKQNEVTFEAKLNSNNIKYNLFQNPSIRINLPVEVEKVVLGDSSILYGNGLVLNEGNKAEVITNENGSLSIVVNIEGSQTAYDENELGLITNIKIPATIILKKDIENGANIVNLDCSNAYSVNNEIEEKNINKEVKLINFKEEIQEEAELTKVEEGLLEIFEQAVTPSVQTDALKLEVTPVRGETTLSNNSVVYEGEFIKYNIKVTNVTDSDIENVKLIAEVPEGLTYGVLEIDQYNSEGTYKYNFEEETRQLEINVGTVKTKESSTAEYEVKVNDLQNEENKNVTTTIKSYVVNQEMENLYQESLIINKSKASSFISVHRYALSDDSWYYNVDVNADEERDVPVKIHFPTGFTVSQVVKILDGQNTGEVDNLNMTINNDNVVETSLASKYHYYFVGQMDVKKVEKRNDGKPIEQLAYVEIIENNVAYISNVCKMELQYQCVDVTMESENEGESVRPGDEINYTVKINNIGGINRANQEIADRVEITLSDFLPENVIPSQMIYNNWEYTVNENNVITGIEKKDNITKDIMKTASDDEGNSIPNIELGLMIPQGESTVIYIKTTAAEVENDTTIENRAQVTGTYIDTKTTQEISHTILAIEPSNVEDDGDDDNPRGNPNGGNQDNSPDDNSNGSDNSADSENYNNAETQEKGRSISGIAWIDENKDGQRQTDESLLSNIEVLLINMQNGGAIQERTNTNSNGTYAFTNISQGKYLVAFKYDINKYRLTEYQKANVNNLVNSDASINYIDVDGGRQVVGLTDTIELLENVSNIDLGLIENELCDFKVDKYISKVTVQTQSGIKEYNYDNQNMAKVEIRAKEIEGATVVVEYKLVITNIGETIGKIGKVIDVLPQGLEFSSELNSQWATDSNGKLTCLSLSNQTIEPGQSQTLTVIATKTMTESSTGTFTNKAEITDIKNTDGEEDTNSSNNTSQADLILSVSTGVITYLSITIAILFILGILAFILTYTGKFKLDKTEKLKKIDFLGALFIAIMIIGISSSSVIAGYASENGNQVTSKRQINSWNNSNALSGVATNSTTYTWDWRNIKSK